MKTIETQAKIVKDALTLGPDYSEEKAFFLAVYAACLHPDLIRTTTDESNFDYGGWFNYFWKEVHGAAAESSDVKIALAKIAAVVFGVGVDAGAPAMGTFPQNPRREFSQMLGQSPGNAPKQALQYMFNLGFKKGKAGTPDQKFMQDIGLVSNLVKQPPPESGIKARFAYRGEGRQPFKVIQHGGARCRADLDFWKKAAHVDAPWHPWAGTDTASSLYFREGNRDNDYFTVTSVAYHMHIACAYPMFKIFEKDTALKGKAEDWDATLRRKATSKGLFIVNSKKKGSVKAQTLVADISYLYVMDIAGETVIQTWDLADYPEAGVRSVPLDQLIAFVRLLRIHHPPDKYEPYHDSTRIAPAMTIHPLGWKWWPSPESARSRLNCTDQGIQHLTQQLDGLLARPFDISHMEKYMSYTYEKPTGGLLQRAYPSL